MGRLAVAYVERDVLCEVIFRCCVVEVNGEVRADSSCPYCGGSGWRVWPSGRALGVKEDFCNMVVMAEI